MCFSYCVRDLSQKNGIGYVLLVLQEYLTYQFACRQEVVRLGRVGAVLEGQV